MKQAIFVTMTLLAGFGFCAEPQASENPSTTNAVLTRRMIVMPFRAAGVEATVYGKRMAPGPYCEEIAAKVNDSLTQARKFMMLNREFDTAIQAELSRLKFESAAADDMVRFKKLMVTDYMVTGSLKLFDSPAVSTNPYTGTVRASDGPFLEVSYRVIHVPTSRQEWANTVMIPYSMAAGSNAETMLSEALRAAAGRIGSEIAGNVDIVK